MNTKWHAIKTKADLPRTQKWVLVTRIDENGKRIVDLDRIFPLDCDDADPFHCWDMAGYVSKVIAWAELPKPYSIKTKRKINK